jgi:hypothetical protein
MRIHFKEGLNNQFQLHKDIPVGKCQLLIIGADDEERLLCEGGSNFYGLIIEWVDKNLHLNDLPATSERVNSLIESGSLEAKLSPMKEINDSHDVFSYLVSGLGGNAFRNGILTLGDLCDHVNSKLHKRDNDIEFTITPGHEELKNKIIGLNTTKIKELDQIISKKIKEFYELIDMLDISKFQNAAKIINNLKIFANDDLISLLEEDFVLQLKYNFGEISQLIVENKHSIRTVLNGIILEEEKQPGNINMKQAYKILYGILTDKISEIEKNIFLSFDHFILIERERSLFTFFKAICENIKSFKDRENDLSLNNKQIKQLIGDFAVSLNFSKNDSTNLQTNRSMFANSGE